MPIIFNNPGNQDYSSNINNATNKTTNTAKGRNLNTSRSSGMPDTFEYLKWENEDNKKQGFVDSIKGAVDSVKKTIDNVKGTAQAIAFIAGEAIAEIKSESSPKYKETTTTRYVSEDEIPEDFKEELRKKGLLDDTPKKVVTEKTPEQIAAKAEKNRKKQELQKPQKVVTEKTPEQIEAKAEKNRRKYETK